MPNPNPIIYSPKSGQFYQKGRRGAISYEEAVKSVRYSESAERYIDASGRFVPSRVMRAKTKGLTTHVARDDQGRPVLSTMTREEGTNRNLVDSLLSSRQVQPNQQILITDTWTDGKGNVYTTYTSSVLGGRTDLESLERVATNRMKGQAWEKAGIRSGQWKTRNHLERSYSIKTIQNPRLVTAA